jgi:hypothetical protein
LEAYLDASWEPVMSSWLACTMTYLAASWNAVGRCINLNWRLRELAPHKGCGRFQTQSLRRDCAKRSRRKSFQVTTNT